MDLQQQLIDHIFYIQNELNTIINQISEDKEKLANMRLAVLFHNVSNSVKQLEPLKAKKEETPEVPQETDIQPVV